MLKLNQKPSQQGSGERPDGDSQNPPLDISVGFEKRLRRANSFFSR
jgi:hypothetical protein